MSDAGPSASTSPPAEREAGAADRALDTPLPVVRDGKVAVDHLAVETPIAFRYNGKSHVVMMASPADLVDFAYGFSLAEGIVADAGEVEAVVASEHAGGVVLAVQIPERRAAALLLRSRNMAGRTGCGLCGVAEIEAALRPLPRLAPAPLVPLRAVDRAIARLPALQAGNRRTGALHAAAFADPSGEPITVREDVGRHNALDKLIGALARSGVDPRTGFVVVTSRCSMEMVQKTATFGCPVLVAVSAPTALAVELAERCGLTVCAFARGQGCNVHGRVEGVTGA